MELNRERIIQGLECCEGSYDCFTCDIYKRGCSGFRTGMAKDALSLIKELTEESKDFEIRALRAENEAAKYKDRWETSRKDFERVADENKKWQTLALKQEDTMQMVAQEKQAYYDELQTVKADTVRKMQERLKKTFEERGFFSYYIILENIDQIAKEIIEGETK